MGNLAKVDDLEVSLFQETSISPPLYLLRLLCLLSERARSTVQGRPGQVCSCGGQVATSKNNKPKIASNNLSLPAFSLAL